MKIVYKNRSRLSHPFPSRAGSTGVTTTSVLGDSRLFLLEGRIKVKKEEIEPADDVRLWPRCHNEQDKCHHLTAIHIKGHGRCTHAEQIKEPPWFKYCPCTGVVKMKL